MDQSRRGPDISISRFVIDETAIVIQAIGEATDNGQSLGCRASLYTGAHI